MYTVCAECCPFSLGCVHRLRRVLPIFPRVRYTVCAECCPFFHARDAVCAECCPFSHAREAQRCAECCPFSHCAKRPINPPQRVPVHKECYSCSGSYSRFTVGYSSLLSSPVSLLVDTPSLAPVSLLISTFLRIEHLRTVRLNIPGM